MTTNLRDPHPYEQYLLALALIVISLILVYTQAAKRLDLLTYDTTITLTTPRISNDVVIISIDEQSLSGIGQWPWRRAVHAELIEKLTHYNTTLVALDIIFSEPDQQFPDDDKLLAQAIKRNGNVLLPLHIQPLSYGNTLTEIMPIPELLSAARGLGHVHVELDEDGLARGLYMHAGVGEAYWPSLAMAMATQVNPMIRYLNEIQDTKAAPYVGVNSQYRLIPFAGPAGSFPTYSYIDVLLDKVPAEHFRDKTVIIGASSAGMGDIIPTPVTGSRKPMSGVELHANAYSALMTQSIIQPVAEIWTHLLTFAFIMIPILVFPRLRPTLVMPAALVLVAIVLSFAWAMLHYDRTWFAPMNSVIGILIAYPIWSWQRMRHLNGFLSDELERLNQIPSIGFRKLGQHPVEKLFLSLLALLRPRRYLLTRNDQLLHSFEHAELMPPKVMLSGIWQHQDLQSWIRLQQDGDSYLLCLDWPDDINIELYRNFLDRLDLSPKPKAKARRHYEQMANRIAQVREAISDMEDMRTFISKGFEEMPEAVLVADSIGIIVYCNSHAESWLQRERDKILGAAVHELFDPEQAQQDNLLHNIARVLTSGELNDFEARLGERDVLIHCIPFVVNKQSDAGMMITMSDISRIRQQQREKNQLIDFLSHDVRSPLVSQLAMLSGLRSGRITWHENLIEEIQTFAERSLNLSEQFLQITRAEQTVEQEFYEFDLTSVAENSLDGLAQQARSKRITLNFESEDSVWMRGNAELIERAITNLVGNAIKYSPADTEVTMRIQQIDQAARIQICDRGQGIAPEELPFLFKRFRRQRKNELSGEKGTGLGLNFVKVVTEKHRGTISVESTPGKGSCFTLDFPALPRG